ncbi:hypothetical protein P3G55_14595 [Leptospira sp. 96542]|nr:hypothetical protein [Leptospira sp. 96542]
MKFYHVIIVLCLLFLNCAGGNVRIKIAEDNSGEILIFQKKINKERNTEFFGSGVKPNEILKIQFLEKSFQFKNYTEILPPGFRFVRYTDEYDGNVILLGIDTSKNSKLLRVLEIEKDQIQMIISEAKKRDDMLRFNTLVEFIQFEIHFPFAISKASFLEPRTAGEWTARLDSPYRLIINIPLESVWKDEFGMTVVKMELAD